MVTLNRGSLELKRSHLIGCLCAAVFFLNCNLISSIMHCWRHSALSFYFLSFVFWIWKHCCTEQRLLLCFFLDFGFVFSFGKIIKLNLNVDAALVACFGFMRIFFTSFHF